MQNLLCTGLDRVQTLRVHRVQHQTLSLSAAPALCPQGAGRAESTILPHARPQRQPGLRGVAGAVRGRGVPGGRPQHRLPVPRLLQAGAQAPL